MFNFYHSVDFVKFNGVGVLRTRVTLLSLTLSLRSLYCSATHNFRATASSVSESFVAEFGNKIITLYVKITSDIIINVFRCHLPSIKRRYCEVNASFSTFSVHEQTCVGKFICCPRFVFTYGVKIYI